MTERGLPITDGAPACPFVALDDDRDGRALAPDHRHRCYAEPRPAPRALAHQEAYCLSSAFPVCPTFQDWARREAAAARPSPSEGRPAPEEQPVGQSAPPPAREPGRTLPPPRPSRRGPEIDGPYASPPRRNPRRDWAAPPPWVAGEDEEPEYDQVSAFSDDPGPEPDEDDDWRARSQGLVGSAADRLAGPDWNAPAPSMPESGRGGSASRAVQPSGAEVGDDEEDEAWPAPVARPPAAGAPRRSVGWPSARGADRADRTGRGSRPAPRPSRRDQARRREEQAIELFGPAWERPRRFEAYPSLRTRVGLANLSRIGVAAIALVLAGIILFFGGPMLVGLVSQSPGSGAGPTAQPSETASATPVATYAPTPAATTYIVAKGDTMSRIAGKFGVTVAQILAANPQVTNPNRIAEGDQLIIPASVPTTLPNQVNGATASPGGSSAIPSAGSSTSP